MDLRVMFQALGDPVRFRIVEELRRSPLCVTDLVEQTGAAQPSVSRHLKTLRESGLIESAREGKWIRYRLAPGALEAIALWSAERSGAVPRSGGEPPRPPARPRGERDDPILFT